MCLILEQIVGHIVCKYIHLSYNADSGLNKYLNT